MWSLERCKSFWFVEERQGKENAINLQLWQKVPQKQLNNFPVTLETEFTPQQTGKLPAITTLEKSTSLDKTSISVCCSSFNVIPVIHHEQYWIWNGILLPNPKDPEFYYQTCRYNQRLGYLLMVQKSSAICQVWFPLIPLPTHKSESPGLCHRNRSQVNTWIHGINLPPPDRRKARTATMLQAGSGRQSFPPDSEQHHTGNSGISLISFHPSRIPVLLPPKSERRTLCEFRELTSTWSFGPAISTQKQHSTSLHAHTNRSDLELGGKINKRAAYHENNTNLSIQVLPKPKYTPLAGGLEWDEL